MSISFKNLHGELKLNEPLSKYTSWRVGGNVDRFYRPKDIADLSVFLSQLPVDEPLLWLGLGSNLLVRDGGFKGTVISTARALQSISIDGQKVHAEVGVYCSKLAKQAAKAGLKGTSFLAGIPGTVGGALAMNAGAHKSDMWSWVESVITINRQGQLTERSTSDFTVAYRQVDGPSDEWFVSTTLLLEQGDAEQEVADIKSMLKQRNASQPTNQPCAGSVFRNPDNDYAGRLIETLDLKGLRIGGAEVSTKHANFIVSDSSATSADIEALISQIQKKVSDKYDILLQPEVHIIGEQA